MKLLPGSLTKSGAVIDWRGVEHEEGPCFIPTNLKPARKGELGKAGWCICPARDWPSLLPDQGLSCIVRNAMKGEGDVLP